ncbi:phospholipase B1, membrane-associated-like [Anoplophora glabripennis]|uniref:phospholipase B1, membrane-associated-like n=1 Tax=Anoplophora glabripennis TaxID=217634 RepID=UPI0008735002|nr:phospholipase B1, membrane-associated-like [Anoplophora glabripennis]
MRSEIGLVTFLVFTSHVQASAQAIKEERSVLEDFLPLFRVFKKASSDAMRRIVEHPQNRRLLKRKNKSLVLSNDMTFPCDLNTVSRSPEVPKTAHEVRPGDIDVIGALGDSLSAGFGASANTLPEVLSEDRGRSFSIGGQETWRTSLTLPNILKMFNPNLIGYSLRTSITLDEESQFNVAEGGAISENMPYMTKELVKRIKSDPRVNLERDWKMITLMIGDNDFCLEMCYYKNSEVFLAKHKRDLLYVLRILKNNLPRTIVNIIPPIHLRILTQMSNKPPICNITHLVECPCIIGQYTDRRKLFFDLMRRWQELDIEVSNYPEFDLDDFTVIPHYYTLEQMLPSTSQGKTDYTFFSPDCFHFSEKGQSLFANNLWNSIMEPFGFKTRNGSPTFSKLKCPTVDHPFIFTRRNSG